MASGVLLPFISYFMTRLYKSVRQCHPSMNIPALGIVFGLSISLKHNTKSQQFMHCTAWQSVSRLAACAYIVCVCVCLVACCCVCVCVCFVLCFVSVSVCA